MNYLYIPSHGLPSLIDHEMSTHDLPTVHDGDVGIIRIPDYVEVQFTYGDTVILDGVEWNVYIMEPPYNITYQQLISDSRLRKNGEPTRLNQVVIGEDEDLSEFPPFNPVDDMSTQYNRIVDARVNDGAKIDLLLTTSFGNDHGKRYRVSNISLPNGLYPYYIVVSRDSNVIVLLDDARVLLVPMDRGWIRQQFDNARPIDLAIGLERAEEVTRIGTSVTEYMDEIFDILFVIVSWGMYFEFWIIDDRLVLKKSISGVLSVADSVPIPKSMVKGPM